jgi:mRNA-degrading endonuclease YafQ of YafQ-DinJ toxin-antitoxin module
MYEIKITKRYDRVSKKFFKKHQSLKNKYIKTIKILKTNPFHPSLRLHKLQGEIKEYHSVSIDMQYRIIIDFIIIDEQIILIDIGSHDDVY